MDTTHRPTVSIIRACELAEVSRRTIYNWINAGKIEFKRTLEKREKKAALDAKDRAERKKCRLRSSGRCEVVTQTPKPESSALIVKRCQRRAQHNHHLESGHGRRNRGTSILHERRLDCCALCHQLIEAGVYSPVDPDVAMFADKVRYWSAL